MRPSSVFLGLSGALLLIGLYLSIMSLDGGWASAVRELGREWWLIGGVTALFGVQVALFATVRSRAHAAAGSGAVSAGTTAGSMLACCLHHAADALPFLGATALSTFVGQYRDWFFALAYLSGALGIALMLRALRHLHGASSPQPNTVA